jgi:hypothetical protein
MMGSVPLKEALLEGMGKSNPPMTHFNAMFNKTLSPKNERSGRY